MAKLKYRLKTEIGRKNYVSQSENLGNIVFVNIITEGCKEELIYLKHIIGLYKRQSSNNDNVCFLNDYYKKNKYAETESHPLKRMDAMIEYINSQDVQESDECWIVCDRDDGSFTEEQYRKLLEDCKKYNVKMVVSNPAFQIWLLFHFTDCLDDLGLEQQSGSKSKIKEIEKCLRKYVHNYEHGDLDMAYFEDKVDDAIGNSLLFANEIESLKDEVGTNVYELINSLKEKFGVPLC